MINFFNVLFYFETRFCYIAQAVCWPQCLPSNESAYVHVSFLLDWELLWVSKTDSAISIFLAQAHCAKDWPYSEGQNKHLPVLEGQPVVWTPLFKIVATRWWLVAPSSVFKCLFHPSIMCFVLLVAILVLSCNAWVGTSNVLILGVTEHNYPSRWDRDFWTSTSIAFTLQSLH